MEYNFQATAAPQAPYGAARFSGHFDRVQSQSGNGAGMIRGNKTQILSQLRRRSGILNEKV